MEPTLKEGETVLVNRLVYIIREPKIKEVVAVRDPRDKKVLIKRVARKENGLYFVLGDNKESSTDSREFGMIKKKEIVGKVMSF